MNTEEIIEIMNLWVSSFSEGTPDNICALYDEQASLWGTVSPLKRDSADLIKEYFDTIFQYQNRNVEIADSNIRIFGNIAICNGLYTFMWLKKGVQIKIAARFSFVYIKKNGRWLIIEHHSSAEPKAA